MCIYVCAIQKHLEDQNVKIWACFSSGDVYTLWLLIKTKTNIEIAILAIRGIKSLRKIQFMSYIYVCYELSHTVWIVQFQPIILI